MNLIGIECLYANGGFHIIQPVETDILSYVLPKLTKFRLKTIKMLWEIAMNWDTNITFASYLRTCKMTE